MNDEYEFDDDLRITEWADPAERLDSQHGHKITWLEVCRAEIAAKPHLLRLIKNKDTHEVAQCRRAG